MNIKKYYIAFFMLVVSFYCQTQPSISLDVTVGTNVSNGACAAVDSVTVDPGTSVNFCYRVINTGNTTFDTHSLNSNVYGNLLTDFPSTLLPGALLQINNIETVTSLVDLSATWAASEGSYTTIVLTSNDVGGPVYNFVDISSTGTGLNLTVDGEIGVSLDFPFTLLNLTSSELTIGNNGAVILGNLNGLISFSNKDLLATFPNNTYNNIIAPFWDDLAADNGNVYYQTLGSPPNRIFIVQWEDRPHYINSNTSGVGAVSFQLKLFETSNEIQFHYQDVQFENASYDFGASATVGFTRTAPSESIQYSYNSIALSDSFAISFVQPNNNRAESMDMALVTVNTPDINIAQSSIEFVEHNDSSNTKGLLIENIGTYTLNWSLEEAANRNFKRLPTIPLENYSDDMASAHAAPIIFQNKNTPSSQPHVARGVPINAYAIRVYPDVTPVFSNIDLNSATLLNEINSSADYDNLFAADFIDGDYNTLYALRNVPSLQLVKIDTSSGILTVIGSSTATGIEFWSGMTWDPSTGNVYAVSTSDTNSTLFSINIDTGVTSVIGTIGTSLIIDIAADITGNLYAISAGTDQLIGINKNTGAGVTIGPTNYDSNFAQGMDFDLTTNTLYWLTCTVFADTDCGGLRTINLATGNSTFIGNIDDINAEYTALAITNDITCDIDVPWLSFSTSSGSTDSGMTSNVGVNIDTTGLANGDYHANICINSDDLDQPVKIVAVNLNVGDLIFRNGFE